MFAQAKKNVDTLATSMANIQLGSVAVSEEEEKKQPQANQLKLAAAVPSSRAPTAQQKPKVHKQEEVKGRVNPLHQQARPGGLQVPASQNRAKSQMPKIAPLVIDYKAEEEQQAIEKKKRNVGDEIHTQAQRLQALGSVATA